MIKDSHYIDPIEWYSKYAVEVKLIDDSFSAVKETLTRIGIANWKEKVLTQSCHIYQKGGKYYITHFKEMLAIDGKPVNIEPEDILRRNRIISLLQEWKLLTVNDPDRIENKSFPTAFTILPYKDKGLWTMKSKYQVGNHQTIRVE